MTRVRLPDFLVIGAGKSGTTSLDNYLGQHPDIFMARKEPCFFAIKSLESINNPADKKMLNHYPNGVQNLEDYKNLFSQVKEGQIAGETSPIYLNSTSAVTEIYNLLPSVKLIVILRHPAERLYSRYLHLANEFRQPDINLIFDQNSIWHSRNDLLKEGYYGKNLSRYFEKFSRDQIKVFLYEDFKDNPSKILSSIFNFLEVDSSFSPDMRINFNQAGFVKNKWLNNLYGRNGKINRVLKKISPLLYSKIKSNNIAYQILNRARARNLNRAKLSLELKKKITEKIYLNDIEELENLLSLDLGHWYKF